MKRQAEMEERDFDGLATLSCGDNCVEVNVATFDTLLLNGTTDVVLEFYSPMCSSYAI
jgi:hypothetical protein